MANFISNREAFAKIEHVTFSFTRDSVKMTSFFDKPSPFSIWRMLVKSEDKYMEPLHRHNYKGNNNIDVKVNF